MKNKVSGNFSDHQLAKRGRFLAIFGKLEKVLVFAEPLGDYGWWHISFLKDFWDIREQDFEEQF